MSCPQEGATLAWMYGEGDDAQVHHVAGCAECTATLTAHEAVLGLVRPIAPALVRAPRRARWPFVVAAVAVAASALVAWRVGAPEPPPPSEIALDDQLSGLDAELSTLADDLDDRSAL